MTTPDAPAIVAANQTISYDVLHRRSNQLASLLRAYGVQANTLVGICIERSESLITGFLGILKAGGAYVPLDATYPLERLAFMLRDAQISVLVTQRHIADRLPLEGIRVVCLDSDASLLVQQSEQNIASQATANDLAYVIYTSGSTGLPKGAQITHNNLLNLIYWHQHAFSVTANDRATQVASPAFDATGWELWPYLTLGASVYIPDEDVRLTPALLRDWLLQNDITLSFLPTPLAESIIALEWPTHTPLRYLLTGADTLRHYPPPTLPFALINNYGLTETTVVSTSGRILPGDTENLPSIGHPIANTQIYILDEQMQLCPIGQAGEMYISGEGVGKGYLNRPELTTQRFISDPFSSTPGALLYKTGDVARYRADGQIEFLGRADYQIKLRGYRIEPSEIETLLNEQQGILSSIVIAREDIAGDVRLVAYLLLAPDATIHVSTLRITLLERLPEYMLPSTFVQLATLPLTPNGKIDRKALPVPDESNTLRDMASEETVTPIEQTLMQHIATLLNIDSVALDDNFFMLGGHSLLATQLIMWIQATFEVNLTLRNMFEAPTVRLLATEIEHRILAQIEAMSDEEARLLLAQENAAQ
jgi:amino acid adenylation domain-containing protein